VPAILVFLGITLVDALIAILDVLLLAVLVYFVRPLVRAIIAVIPGGRKLVSAAHWFANLPRYAKVVLWPIVPVVGAPIALVKGAEYVEHQIRSSLGHHALSSQKPAAAFLSSLAVAQKEIWHELAGFTEATADALSHLTTATIPALVIDGLDAFRVRIGDVTHSLGGWIGVLERGLDRLNDRAQALEDALAGIDIGGVTAYIDQSIDRLKTDTLEQLGAATAAIGDRIGALADEIEARFRLGIDHLTSRIDMLFELVAPAALAAAAVAAVTAFAPQLFCRNTGNVARKLCGLDEALLAALLATSLSLLVVVDPVAIARAALVAEEVIEPVIREVAA
jgi:hypothetical protein